MTRYRVVPAIVTLLSGFITSVLLILNEYELKQFIMIVILVMVCFFVVSWLVVYILNKEADKQEKEKQRLEEEKEKEEEIPDIDLDHIDDIEGLGGKEYDFNDFDNE